MFAMNALMAGRRAPIVLHY